MVIALLLGALALGLAANALRLPPLVGYLVAGFVLHALGVRSTAVVEVVGELGVLLLLFGIGLKLRVRTLARPEVWGTATAFGIITTAASTGLVLALSAVGLPLLRDLDLAGALTVAFALSFCSTVFAVKLLDRANESQSLAGRVAVGVLIVQDLFAVAFLVAIGGMPSPWALLVIPALLVLRPVLGWLLDVVGHGELLVLLGVALAVAVGAAGFDLVGLKPDLGALVVGILLARHPRAAELSSKLLDLKDLLLVGFFLSIGLTGAPSPAAWLLGLVLVALLPLRSLLLLWLLTRFRLRVRTALSSTLTLSTYSEFGLIVAAAAVTAGVLPEEWLPAIAVPLALSLLFGSALAPVRFRLFNRFGQRLASLERTPTIEDDSVIDISHAPIVVFGMGRVGTGAYDELRKRKGDIVLGVDHNDDKLLRHLAAGREVIRGDALDRDFWERVRLHDEVELVVAAMGRHAANLECVRRIRQFLPDAQIASIATYADQIAELEAAGVDVARNLYEEAGQALADDTIAVVYGEADALP